MKQFFSYFRPSTHIVMKIWLTTAAIALACFLLIGLGAQVLLSNYFLNVSLKRAKNSHDGAVLAVSSNLGIIITRFVDICGTEEFQDYLEQIRNTDKSGYVQLNNSLQDTIYDLVSSSSLIKSAVISSRQGQFYRLSSQSLKKDGLHYTLGYDETKIQRITLLPVQENPIQNQSAVLPLAFPLSSQGSSNFTIISESAASSDAILYLLLDASGLNSLLHAYSDSSLSGSIYLMTNSGQILNRSSEEADYIKAENLELGSLIESMISKDNTSEPMRFEDHYILCSQIGKRNIYLVNLIPCDDLLESIHTIRNHLGAAVFISILFLALAMLVSAIYITKPLKCLMNSVHSIEDGSYKSDQILKNNDELGKLSTAIDSLYHTIQEQIKQITEERQAKYNAEIRLFAEQINPHFLYNTLEYINLEVYNHHDENAAFMIQSLGDFLRIGLNFGSEQITISQEIDHVQAYLNIMNHRFAHRISFTTDVSPDLLNCYILKIILQPLVENSIRHGFLLDGNTSYLASPFIRLHIYCENDFLILEIIDNGVGIDVEKAQRIMMTGREGQKHVGLNNVYQRLKVFYGSKVAIAFTSIPYYKNTVQIQIPWPNQTSGTVSHK